VAEVMDTEPVWVRADDEQEEAARLVARYDLLALPVLDNNDRLVGIVTADDAMDVTEEEVTEDFHKGSIVQPLEMSVAEASIALLYRARIFWLVLWSLAISSPVRASPISKRRLPRICRFCSFCHC
jgi:magnesium transporter